MFEIERQQFDSYELRTTISVLLPPNATAPEYDIVAVSTRLELIEFPLERLLDPAVAPIELLPWLAWGRSVDFWDENWSDERKRSITVRSAQLHRLKGTKAGIREFVRYADATLRKVVAAPVRAFAGKDETLEEREAWLAQMPQLRLYRYRSNGNGKTKFFANHGFAGHAFARLSDAELRLNTRAFYYDQGQEIPIRTYRESSVTVEGTATTRSTIRIPGDGRNAFFVGQAIREPKTKHPTLLGRPRKRGLIYTIDVDTEYDYTQRTLALKTVTTGLTPVTAQYDLRKVHGTTTWSSLLPGGREAVFRKRHMILNRKFLPRTTAGDRLFQQLYLHDPSRARALRGARIFCGNLRLGITPFTAELDLLVLNKRPKLAFGMYCRGYLHTTPPTRINNAISAVRVSKAARDRVLIRLGLYRRPNMGEGLPLDTGYRFGDRLLRS